MYARDIIVDQAPHTAVPAAKPRKAPARLGEILIEQERITQAELRRALELKYRSGAPLGEVLLENQFISEQALCGALAAQWSLDVVNLDIQGPEMELLSRVDPHACIRIGAVPWRQKDRRIILVVSDPTRIEEAKVVCGYKGRDVGIALAPRTAIAATLERIFARELERDACLTCPEHLSARNWNKMICAAWGTIVILSAILAFLIAPKVLFWVLFSWIFLINLSTAVFRLALVAARFWPKPRQKALPPDVTPLAAHQQLPRVTVMIGLLNEDLVLPRLLKHLAELDYPRELLEVLLLLEEGDDVTPRHLAAVTPARPFDVVVVPKGTLQTKPRALNYGMSFARGEIVGILDAEDRPAPDQIKHVVESLHNAPPDVACVQGVLDFYNSRRNWLSRCFTIEYSIWFQVLLGGMRRLNLPIPLGGTTVYFRRSVLEKIGAWDAHNVTEDADLGMRLYRFGYRTEVMKSVTMEEANAAPLAWIKQRSRWIKGYIVTWATHMARPRALLRDLGLRGFLTFQVLLLGGVTSYLSIPLLWGLWIGAFGFDLQLNLGGNSTLWQWAFVSMIFGQVVMLAVAAGALCQRGKRHLIPWIFTLPIYWPLGAIAGYKALYEVFFAPYYWDKTKHGHQSDQSET